MISFHVPVSTKKCIYKMGVLKALQLPGKRTYDYFGFISGGWSSWSEWSSWGKGLCSGNQRVKTRTCTNPLPQSSSDYCQGEHVKQENGPSNLFIHSLCFENA